MPLLLPASQPGSNLAKHINALPSTAVILDAALYRSSKASLLKQADLQCSIESQAHGWELITCFFTISGAMFGKHISTCNRLILYRYGRDAWELKGLTSAKIASRM